MVLLLLLHNSPGVRKTYMHATSKKLKDPHSVFVFSAVQKAKAGKCGRCLLAWHGIVYRDDVKPSAFIYPAFFTTIPDGDFLESPSGMLAKNAGIVKSSCAAQPNAPGGCRLPCPWKVSEEIHLCSRLYLFFWSDRSLLFHSQITPHFVQYYPCPIAEPKHPLPLFNFRYMAPKLLYMLPPKVAYLFFSDAFVFYNWNFQMSSFVDRKWRQNDVMCYRFLKKGLIETQSSEQF